MHSINNCEELIEFLIRDFKDYPFEVIIFQGDLIEITETDFCYEELGFIINKTLISLASSAEGYFDVKALSGAFSFTGITKSICVPDYVKKEFIASLKKRCM